MQTHIPETLGFAALASLAVLAWYSFAHQRLARRVDATATPPGQQAWPPLPPPGKGTPGRAAARVIRTPIAL